MNKDLTELVFIIDKSGSMAGLESDTIGGFNGMIEHQKKESGKAIVYTVLFASTSDVIHDRVPIEKVRPMTDEDYHIGGSTALIDAIGSAIHRIDYAHRYGQETDVPGKTIFIITTDGMENSSKTYSYQEVRRMIEDQKRENHWEFFFLGANFDAVETAAKMGISSSRSVRFHNDKQGIALNYETIDKTVRRIRKCDAVTEDWKASIQKDYSTRQ